MAATFFDDGHTNTLHIRPLEDNRNHSGAIGMETIHTIKLGEAAALMGVPRTTLCDWIRAGLIRETIIHGDEDKCRRVDFVALLTGCIVRQQRARGWSWAVIAPLAHFLHKVTEQQLERDFAEGRGILVFVPGVVPPRLIREGETIDEARGRMLAAIAVPLERNWRQMLAKLPKHVARKATVIELAADEPTLEPA